MVNLGVPLHIIQRYLGHESPAMTMVYAHIHDETLRKEIEKYHESRVVNFKGESAELDETILSSNDEQGEKLYIIPQTLIEFWAVAARPLTSNGLGLTVDEAEKATKKLKRIFMLFPDTPVIFTVWENLVTKYQVMGKQAHDTRLVAAMITHKMTHLLTFNTDDFKRFSETGFPCLAPTVFAVTISPDKWTW